MDWFQNSGKLTACKNKPNSTLEKQNSKSTRYLSQYLLLQSKIIWHKKKQENATHPKVERWSTESIPRWARCWKYQMTCYSNAQKHEEKYTHNVWIDKKSWQKNRKYLEMEMWELENKSERKKNPERFSQKTEANEIKSVKNVRSIEITQSEKQGEKCLNYLESW